MMEEKMIYGIGIPMTLWDAAEYMREVHDVHVTTGYCSMGWYWSIKYLYTELFRTSSQWYATHDEAYEAGIRFAVKELSVTQEDTTATTACSEEEVRDALLGEVKTLSSHGHIDEDTPWSHLDLDSLDKVTILAALGRKYGVVIEESDVPTNGTLGDIAKVLTEMINEGQSR